jgi:uncharacterized MAPEG superfamily protein
MAAGAHSTWSSIGIGLYLGGRIAYLPLYARGVFLLRSIAWNIATTGIVAIFIGLFV